METNVDLGLTQIFSFQVVPLSGCEYDLNIRVTIKCVLKKREEAKRNTEKTACFMSDLRKSAPFTVSPRCW